MAEPVDTPIGTVTAEHFRPGHVRHRVFAGPKFLYAMFNPRDQLHVVSRAFMDFLRDGDLPFRRLVVNEHIIDEAATRLKKQASIQHAAALLTTLDESQLYRRVSVSDSAFDAATARFIDWRDLGASFTDFVVASHMRESEIDHILTFDRHYEAFDVTSLPYRR